MIRRPFYLKQLEQWIDKPLVKILTGIRRSGKSTILLLLKKVLLEKGITENSIIALNFESLTTEHLKNAPSLYEYLAGQLTKDKKFYIFWTKFRRFRLGKK